MVTVGRWRIAQVKRSDSRHIAIVNENGVGVFISVWDIDEVVRAIQREMAGPLGQAAMDAQPLGED